MKKLKYLILPLVLIVTMIIPVNGQSKYVQDDAYIFMDADSRIEQIAQNFYDKYEVNVVVLTKNDATVDLSSYANNYYQENYGSSDGIIFAFNQTTDSFNYYINTFGVISDYVDTTKLADLFTDSDEYELEFAIQKVIYQIRCNIDHLEASKDVVDYANILTSKEISKLAKRAAKLEDEYDIDVAIVTTYATQGKDMTNFTDDYYDYNDYGVGYDKSGLVLVLNMDTREWYISTCGVAIDAYSDETLDYIGEEILPDLKNGDYYEAFDLYLDKCDNVMACYQEGNIFDPDNQGAKWPINLLIAIIAGAIISAIVSFSRLSKLKTRKVVHDANNYIKVNGFNLTRSNDLFLYSNVTKTRRQQSNGGGHHSSTHRSSSGGSHGGRGGKF